MKKQLDPPADDPKFDSLGLDPRILSVLVALGYEEPTPVQLAAIPPLMEGRDVVGQAATGTGKTAAFALPLLHRLTPKAPPAERTAALVLVPTRELAMQVAEAIHRYGREMGAISLPIYGGASMETQLRALARGVDVVVATPGRAMDHIRRKSLRLASVRVVILDEADEMLDMGFAEDLEAILDQTPKTRQTALFSATIPPRISEIAAKYMNEPVRLRIEREVVPAGSAPRVRQVAYIVPRNLKMAALGRVLDVEHPTSAIVFCRTRTEVDELTETLNGRGFRAEALHGGLNQAQRDRVMKAFRAGTTDLLVATDVAARGLDIRHVSHVVNYDVPSAAEGYVHRIGRTGRAGGEGVAITLAEPREHRLLRAIERLTKQTIEIANVPTVADLKAKRLEVTRAALRDTIVAGELDAYRVVVESLAEEFDVMDVAAAAVKQADLGRRAADEAEIPAVAPPPVERPRPFKGRKILTGPARPRVGPSTARGGKLARLFVGAGKQAGVRPGDLVGAIANEARVDARVIGAIQIGDRHSIVEVPDAIADAIVTALRATTLQGKRVTVRRDRDLSR
jgi:ATP-dependent RNA helicase DeaD